MYVGAEVEKRKSVAGVVRHYVRTECCRCRKILRTYKVLEGKQYGAIYSPKAPEGPSSYVRGVLNSRNRLSATQRASVWNIIAWKSRRKDEGD